MTTRGSVASGVEVCLETSGNKRDYSDIPRHPRGVLS